MKRNLKELVGEICQEMTDQIEKGLKAKDDELVSLIFDANNDFQESCRDGAGYIFNLDNQEDLSCCVKGGLTWNEIARMKEINIFGKNPFLFGHNYTTPRQITTEDELIGELIMWVENIVYEVISTPYAYGSYAQLYSRYISQYLS